MEQHSAQGGLGRFVREHQGMSFEIARLETWIKELNEPGVADFDELGDHVTPLFEQIRQHFEQEEVHGLPEVIAIAPELTGQVKDLFAQHSRLSNQMDAFIERLHAPHHPFANWHMAISELDAVLMRLARHERQEQSLLAAVVRAEDGAGNAAIVQNGRPG